MKRSKTLLLALLEKEIVTSCEMLYTKFCTRTLILVLQKDVNKIWIFLG